MARRRIQVDVDVDVKGAGKLTGLSKSLQSTGANLSAMVTLPLLAAGVASFKFASDVDESMSKASQVFEGEASKVIAASEDMNDAFGQATFLDTAGTFGALLTNMGLTEAAAAEQSIAWLQLAQDMASFHNVDPTQALGAIQSALAGEFEPLKQFGVMLNVATLEARALEMGIWDGVGALTEQQKLQVINAELYGQQSKVIGDYSRTAGGAANMTRTITGNFEDAAASLGKELLPAGLAILRWIQDVVKWFKNLAPEQRTMIVNIGLAAAAVGPLLLIGGKMIGMIQTMTTVVGVLGKALLFLAANPVGALIAAIAAAAFLIVTYWDEIGLGLQVLVELIRRAVAVVVRLWQQFWAPFSSAFDGAIRVVKAAWNLFAGFWNSLDIDIPAVDIPFVGRIGGFSLGLPDLPIMDAGGIVSDPTLALLAANSRPEAIVPLDRAGALGGITVVIQTGVGDPVEIGREVVEAIRAYERANGPAFG